MAVLSEEDLAALGKLLRCDSLWDYTAERVSRWDLLNTVKDADDWEPCGLQPDPHDADSFIVLMRRRRT